MFNYKLYGRFLIAYLKCRMEYRFAFYMDVFIQIFTYTIMYLNIWILLNKFHAIQGWTFYEVMLLYNLNLFSYGLCGLIFWTPMRGLEGMVQQGTFDSILIRPMNPFVHLLLRNLNTAFIGHIILGGVVFVISLNKLAISWTIDNIVSFILILLGAMFIQAGIMIIGGSLSFWFTKSRAVVNISIYGIRNFVNYPISIYNKFVRILLTFIIPYAFVNYYPAMYFLNKENNWYLLNIYKFATPMVGIIIFLFSYQIWKRGINKYQSTGS